MDSRYVERRVFLFAPKTIKQSDSLVCQRNALRMCVHSLIPLVCSVHAPHSIACSSVRVLRTVSEIE